MEEEKIVKDINEVKQRENGAGCGTAIASLISGAVVTVIIPSLTVVKLKKVLQASIYAACETFLLRNEL